ncbi:TRPM8 channel-associated factor homolog [Varanus komodoensis]|nr:TRPM8 channel-associated factor homolog [Varanus komodoensis]
MDPRTSYASLVKGIQSFQVKGDFNPCELLLTGDQAFPVLVSTNGQVLIAASQYGKGRMVVAAHESILQLPQFLPFLKNALEWLKPSSTAPVGVHPSLHTLSEMLLSNGVKVQADMTLADSLGVYCIDAYDDTLAEDLVLFIKNGKGLLIGGQAWYWSYTHGAKKVVTAFPGNKVTSVGGVYFTANEGQNGDFPVPKEMPSIPLITRHRLNTEEDLKILLNGVTQFNIHGDNPAGRAIPARLLIHGTLAFPVGITDSHLAFLGAAYYGRGRVVVASHEALLEAASMEAFLVNAIRWLTDGKGGMVGITQSLQNLYSILNKATIPCAFTNLKHGLAVYCCTAYSDAEREKIHEFVSEGGGLLIGGQAWIYRYPNASAIKGYPGNKILNKFGIAITGETLDVSSESCPAGEAGNVALSYHFRKALSQLKECVHDNHILQPKSCSDLNRVAQDFAAFVDVPAANLPAFSSVHMAIVEVVQLCGIPDVSAHKPVKSNSAEAALLNLAWTIYNILPAFQHLVPSLVETFPTAAPQTIWINGKNDGPEAWRSTGMYIPPAKTATLDFPPTAIGAKLQVQIGCHSDNLSKAKKLRRPPVMVRRFEVKSCRMEVSSLWGGLLYIVLPEKSSLGSLPVTIKGATLAPYYKQGETNLDFWKSTICHYPAPWAELETENIILTFPSDEARSISDPELLLNTWAQIMKAVAKLASIPPVFPRPERIVTDVQISHGWMHAGYPIMADVRALQEITDVQAFFAKGTWGPIHELGHNQQREAWDFWPHTSEATCNLWSVYANETVLNIPRHKAHPDLKPHLRQKRIQDYIRNGAQLKDFEVFTALEPYLQLQEAFGWEPYIRIFAKYQTKTDIPPDNKSKMNLWAEMFSQQVQKNLGPFFKAWGWPIKVEISHKLATSYPPWAEDPMSQYRCC